MWAVTAVTVFNCMNDVVVYLAVCDLMFYCLSLFVIISISLIECGR